jgi:phosphatidate cytidylyltransferase
VLITRILSAAILIPLVVLAAYLGGWWFAGLVSLFAALAVIEFYQLARRLGPRPSLVAGTMLSIGVILAAQFPNARITPALFTTTLAVLMVVYVIRQDFDRFLGDWAVTITGSAYVGGLLSYFVLLRNLEQGLAWVVLAAAVTWLGDTGAYLVGTAIGQRPFFPRVSPRKTLEGAIAGMLIGTLSGVAVGTLWLRLYWPVAAALGLLTSLAATFGDLAESLIKRQAGAKDSGNLIPGHGGALDRVDSLLFAGAVVYYAALWLTGAQ